ncbi:hypothetical protein LF1_29890 [Rubripirellula obstinata]|uniref:Ice-binding protein C-terminal domain-containing protein n=1 Tax=Rubripirellula obstinata TaxID=406547 RepID=A0A5B1CL18_9BACT|nr:PEP-CTERM sorting domain-containing protein [Rubripirellula obstinata]KAA1260449.1 hypothetical protein LF1_29890 [Rubripirellula obstinata]
MRKLLSISIPAMMVVFIGLPNTQAQTVFSEAGATAADVTDTVDGFRTALGTLNPFEPTDFPSGRRQINWDAAPDAVSAPNPFAGNFFNFSSSPRARGIEFSTPGTGFQLSATEASGVGEYFANINSQYGQVFDAFSPERLFTPLSSNVTEVSFFSPSDQTTPALTNGFGVIFSDVDFADTTSIELFDINDASLGVYFAENYAVNGIENPNQHFSFLGVAYDDPIISSALITTGTDALGGLEDLSAGVDLVVMDDIIFGEPQAVPEPSSTAALLLGLLAAVRRRRRS